MRTAVKRLVSVAVVCFGVLMFGERPSASPPDPAEGPGGPILIVTSGANPFARYYVEILQTEGLNEFTAMDLSLVDSAVLNAYDVVILGEMPLTSSQVTMFGAWVNGGGNLIAMRPDKQLYGLLGLSDANSTLSNAYLLFNTSTGPGVGLVGEPIQFHGAADNATLNGAASLATLYSNATTPTANPAVTVRDVGGNGGQAAAFLFDLARSVIYTRQGNPAWSGQERDGVDPIRSDDLFFPDWVDLNKVPIPQADEQQRLLANLIMSVNVDLKPLPRFWYFPRGKKAVVVMTGDDHAIGGTGERFEQYKLFSAPNCSVADWECVRSTSYMYPDTVNSLTNAQAQSYNALGFEMFVHLNTNCANWTQATLESFYSTQIAAFSANFPSLPGGVSHRAHCIAWSDYDTQPQVELTHGIRFDTNYYYWPPEWVANRPGMFTGSGMPMRFTKADGTRINVYQAATQITDESGQLIPNTIDALLDNAVVPIAQGGKGYYGAFTANMHTDYNDVSDPKHSMEGSNAIIASAQSRGVPVVSSRQMLTWLDGRNASSFSALTWNAAARTLSFAIAPGTGANGLQAMLPARSGSQLLTSLLLGGLPVTYTIETIKGVDYALFNAAPGGYQAAYAPDTAAPVISNVAATVNSMSTAVITWTTDEPATSHVDFGTAAGALQSGPTNPALVTSHSMSLTGLTANTTYFYRVQSADGVLPVPNSSVSAVATFTTPNAAFKDTTVADFTAGTPGTTRIELIDDGAVTLGPGLATGFDGTQLPPGWSSCVWSGNDCIVGGGAIVENGLLTVNGARVNTDAFYSPGHSLEFVATLSGHPFQHAGFGTTFAAPPWAHFSTNDAGCPNPGPDCPAGTDLWVKTHNGVTELREKIPGAFLGSPQRFRIDWNATNVTYSINGTVVAVHPIQISSQMRPIAASDYFASFPGTIVVDSLSMDPPYLTTGTFRSRVFDALGATNWGILSWTAATPAGTGASLSIRTGNTPTPDATWTAFRPVLSGQTIGDASRYLQYSAQLTTNSDQLSPVLQEVLIGYDAVPPPPDTTPPQISNISATATSFPSSSQAVVTWTTDEFADSQVIYGTSPSALTGSVSSSTLVTSHSVTIAGLLGGRTYYYRVLSADAAHNLATAPLPPAGPNGFTTGAPPPATFVDTTVADFSAGAPGTTTYVSQTSTTPDDGEVILAPTAGAEFFGSALPAGWFQSPWASGGSVTVAGGRLTADGAAAGLGTNLNTGTLFGSGRSLEFVATFTGQAGQHIGFDVDFNSGRFALFSTKDGSGLFARSSVGGAEQSEPLGTAFFGAPHRYRIQWGLNSVSYFIDNQLVSVAAHTITIADMRPMISDFTPGGGALTIDWMRMTPYASPGTFVSRIFDAGSSTDWTSISWVSQVPTGANLVVSVRTGNINPPDGSWTPFTQIPSGTDPGSSRYIQYQAVMSPTPDLAQSPVLESVSIGFPAGQPANTAPVAANDSYAVNEDTPLNVAAPGVIGNDTDANGDPLTAVLMAKPSHARGTFTLNADGSFSYTPEPNFNGTDAFTYKVSDGLLDSNVVTVTMTVNPVNDAPVAVNDLYGIDEDTALMVPAGSVKGVLANDTDVDAGALLTAHIVANATHGVVGLNSDGSFTYSPNRDFNGTDTFTYKANDGAADSNVATVSITVRPVNDAPVAVADSYSVDEDTVLTVKASLGLLANDTDVEHDPLTVVLVPGVPLPGRGSVAVDKDGAFTYTPTPNFNGQFTFSYQANDGTLDSAAVTVTITVNPVNDAPVATDDVATTAEDTPIAIAVLANDSDIDTGQTLSVASVTPGPGGSVSIITTGPDAGKVRYTPNANFSGTDTFTYVVKDSATPSLLSNTAKVTVTVTPVNDAPTISDIANTTTPEDTATGAISFTIGDVDTAATALTVSGSSSNTTLVPNTGISFGGTGTSRTVTLTPAANQSGSAVITVTVSDGAATTSDTFVLTVTPVNDPPTISDIANTTTPEDTSTAAISFTIGDVETPAASLALSGASSNTTLVPAANIVFGGSGTARTVTVNPALNHNGTATITVTVNDGTGGTASDSFLLTVTAVNDAPTISDIADATTPEDTAATIGFTVGDVETAAGSLQVSATSSNTTLVPSSGIALGGTAASRTVTLTPAANQTGKTTITVTVTDIDGGTSSDSFTLSVSAANDAPVANDDRYSTNEDVVVTVAAASGVLANDTDVDSTALTAVLVSGPAAASGAVALNTDGSFTFTPALDFNGAATFTYKTSDGTLSSNVATVTINVAAVNDAPLAIANSYSTNEDVALTIPAPGVLGNDTDVDNTSLTAVLVSGPASGTLTLNANGSFTYTPALNVNGPVTFTYKANDGTLDSNTATVTINISAVNDPPAAKDDSYSTNEDSAITVPAATGVLANDSDVDGNPLTAVLVTAPATASGSLTLNGNGSFAFSPAANFNGTATFTYKASDSTLASNVATVTIVVAPVNDPPTATADTKAATEDTALTFAAGDLLANDTAGPADEAGQTLTVVGVSAAVSGTVVLNANQTITFTPAAQFAGAASFTYTVRDNGQTAGAADPKDASATVTVNVAAVNDLPTAKDDVATTAEETAVVIDVLANDTDPDALDTKTVDSVTVPAHGTVGIVTTGADTGKLRYTPSLNFAGTDVFSYRMRDTAGALSNAASVSVTVTNVNDAPTATTDSKTAIEDTPLRFAASDLVANDTDVDGDTLTVTAVAGASNGTVALNAGIVTFTPANNVNGAGSFNYTVSDGHGGTATGTVNVTITSVNDAPIFAAGPNQAAFASGGAQTVVGWATGISAGLANESAQALDFIVTNTNNAIFSVQPAIQPNGTLTYTPMSGTSGSATVSVRIHDNGGIANGGVDTSAVQTFTITVSLAATTSTTITSHTPSSSTFGQSVTLTAMVANTTGSGGTPTGTVQFFDNGTAIAAPVAVTNGTAQLVTAAINAGTRSITAAYQPSGNFIGSTSPPVTQTVGLASGTTALGVVALVQYSDAVTWSATFTPSAPGGPAPRKMTFKVGTQILTPDADVQLVGGVYKATWQGQLLEPSGGGNMKPGAHQVTATTNDPNFVASSSIRAFSIAKEDARITDTTPATVKLGAATGTVPLSANVKDISAMTGDPAWDNFPGDIDLATVTFIDRGTGAAIATVPVVDGVARFDWAVNLGTATTKTFTIGFMVSNYYNRSNTADNATVVVNK